MRLGELLRDIAYRGKAPLEAEVSFITDDSRKVVPGSVFVCVEGAHFDGHSAAAEAIARGAVCLIVRRDSRAAPQLFVKDSRAVYAQLCAAFWGNPSRKLTLVGVTGTNGKTTTACLLKQIFDHAGYTTGFIGTQANNLVGDREVPAGLYPTTPDPWELQQLFQQMVDAGCTHCFLEATSQALDQHRLLGLRFKVGIFSNLTLEHLDYHKTFDRYLIAKRKLFEQSEIAITNLDDEYGLRMFEGTRARRVTYSIASDHADYTAKNVELRADGVDYVLVGRGQLGRVHFGVPAEFSVYNSMAAACAALELGLELPGMVEAIGTFPGVPGRMEVVPINKDYTVIIDYAHTPDALEKVLRALRPAATGRLLCVFGCGGERDIIKRPLMGKIAAELADVAIVSTDNPRDEDPEAIIAAVLAGIPKTKAQILGEPDREKAVIQAMKMAKPGDIVLLAGKGHEDYQYMAEGKVHFSEREIVLDNA